MHYADSLQDVLLRKIQKAEQEVLQLKLDYCRFVFGLTHRSRVVHEGTVYRVCAVDVATMERQEDGRFTRPEISGVPLGADVGSAPIALGTGWTLESSQAQPG